MCGCMPAQRFKTLYRNCLRKREDFREFLQHNRIERCRMEAEKFRALNDGLLEEATSNVSSTEQRDSNPLNRTHPVEGKSDGQQKLMNLTYPLFQQSKEPTEANRTQTIEDGPTLMNRTHPVAIGRTLDDELPKQQQHKQHVEQDASAPGAVPPVADDSSLLLLDPSLSAACPLINIIDSPKLLEGAENDKTENLELVTFQRKPKDQQTDAII